MHKPPAQVEQIATDLGPISRKTDEIVVPQAIVRADNDEWIIVGMRSKGNAQKQCTGTTKKDQHCNALPVQTAPFSPGSGGQVNGLKTDVPGALDPTSPNNQLGRDVMGRTIRTDGVQRMTPRIQLAQMESPYRPGLEGLTTQEAARANCLLRMEPTWLRHLPCGTQELTWSPKPWRFDARLSVTSRERIRLVQGSKRINGF
jgi:hypothetical protein